MRPPSEVFVWTPPRRNSKVVNDFVVHLLVDVRSRHVATSRHTANRHEVICAVIQIFYRVGTSLRIVGANVYGFYCRKFTLFVSVRWFVAVCCHACNVGGGAMRKGDWSERTIENSK